MKFALFFLLTGVLALSACSDRDPVSSNQPTAAAAKRVISNVTWTRSPAAGRAESRIHPLGVVEVRASEGRPDPLVARAHHCAVGRHDPAVRH